MQMEVEKQLAADIVGSIKEILIYELESSE